MEQFTCNIESRWGQNWAVLTAHRLKQQRSLVFVEDVEYDSGSCLRCCLPSGIMGIVEVEESAPDSLAEAEEASLCCRRISSSRVRRLTYVMGSVSMVLTK